MVVYFPPYNPGSVGVDHCSFWKMDTLSVSFVRNVFCEIKRKIIAFIISVVDNNTHVHSILFNEKCLAEKARHFFIANLT